MSEIVLIEKMIAVIPNKYEAVRVIAKEARRINSVLIRGAGEIDQKPTMLALDRLLEGKIKHGYAAPVALRPDFSDDETE